MEYPNQYYEELANRIIKNPTLRLKPEEVCFYQGPAESFQTITTTHKGKPQGGKLSFFWTPWFWGVKKSAKTVEVTTETRNKYYSGMLYVTNMRIVFKCKIDAFDALVTQIKTVKRYQNGIEVFVGRKSYKVMTDDLNEVLHVFDLINKAQDPNAPTTAKTISRRSTKVTAMDKLDNGELPWGWYTHNESFIKPRDSKLYELSSATASATSVDDEIAKLKIFIEYYYSYKNECFNKDECFKKYFEDMHMKCHNSKNECFEFVTPKEQRLKYLQDNYDELREGEIEKNLAHQTLEEDLIKIISENPGILQSELVKRFPESIKAEVTEKLYFGARDGKIRREKNGRSYSLYL